MKGERTHHRGFTLIELMIAVAVTAVIAAVISLGLRNMMAASALEAASREVASQLALARMRAVATMGNARMALSPRIGAHWLEVYDDAAGGFVVDGPVQILQRDVHFSEIGIPAEDQKSVFYVRFNSRGGAVDRSGMPIGEQSIVLGDGRNTVTVRIFSGGQARAH